MEAKCLSEPVRMSSDIINTLPQAIIEIILCLLPIEEAARTSILSTEWRYKWTTISSLVFDYSTLVQRTSKETQTSDLASVTKNMDWRCKLFYAIIHQVLLLRQGPIHEFTLSMTTDDHYFEIDQIILHLSRNHALKKLTLEFDARCLYKLPICVFSLHQLTDLDLSYIKLDHQVPLFGGFPNLRSLCLFDVRISAKALLHLLSNSPSLTSFTLHTRELTGDDGCTIIELFECLPLIEHLDIVLKELPTSLIHLKYVCLHDMRLLDGDLRILLVLSKCSSNLKKIRLLELGFDRDYEDLPSAGVLEEYSDVWLEHLNELEIESFSDYKHQINNVKFILARSPKLKKVQVSFFSKTNQQKSHILKALLLIPRASPVEIVVA